VDRDSDITGGKMGDRYGMIVIGAGAGGLAAARSGNSKGKIALVEAKRPGGECTFTGCVPSKTLVDVAGRVARVRDRGHWGIRGDVEVDLGTVLRHVREVVEEIAQDESPDKLRAEGIDLVEGRAHFLDPHAVEVSGRVLRSERFVIAVGARPEIPAIDGLHGLPILTNETIFALEETPRHLAIVGGGGVGCELAQAFARLGVSVSLLEVEERVLAVEEPEASDTVRRVLERDGVEVRTGTRPSRGLPGPTLELGSGERIDASHVLITAGRRPRTEDLGLEAAGVDTDEQGSIVVDNRSRTSAKHIYAVGDCAHDLKFTHVADEQGRTAARDAFSRMPHRLDNSALPWVTFTDPEVGRVGMTEQRAYERFGERARVAVMPIGRTDRGRCSGERDGFVKLIAAPGRFVRSLGGGRLVGMTAVCSTGGELIAEGALAMRGGMLPGRIAQTVHAYPTWSIAVRQAAAQWFVGLARPAGPNPSNFG